MFDVSERSEPEGARLDAAGEAGGSMPAANCAPLSGVLNEGGRCLGLCWA